MVCIMLHSEYGIYF